MKADVSIFTNIDDRIQRFGPYCGRTSNESETWTGCPWGTRAVESPYVCNACLNSPDVYDWLYLGFMVVLAWILHALFIEFCRTKRSSEFKHIVGQHLSAFVECALSAMLSLLVLRPYGSLQFYTCSVNSISDWYTMWFNPTINYTKTVYCSQEAVYPLFSLPLIYYAFCLISMCFIRPLIGRYVLKLKRKLTSRAIYAALYFLPFLSIFHAALSGVIYYAFPYLFLLTVLVSHTVFLAYCETQTVKGLTLELVRKPRSILVLLVHWALFGYCIVAMTRLEDPVLSGGLLCLVCTPTLFYVLTVALTRADYGSIGTRCPGLGNA